MLRRPAVQAASLTNIVQHYIGGLAFGKTVLHAYCNINAPLRYYRAMLAQSAVMRQ